MSASAVDDAAPVKVVVTRERHPLASITPLSALKSMYTYSSFLPVVLKTSVGFYFGAGPSQQSWPIEIALFSELCRHAAKSRTPRDPTLPPVDAIAAISKFRQFEKLLPPAKNGFTVSVQIPVKRLNLEGVLKAEDGKEDGTRVLEAEWVTHNELCSPDREPVSHHVVLYLHGGGYALCSPKTHRPLVIAVSKATNARVLSVDYRLAPESPFPAGLHDAIIAYSYLLEQGIPAKNIIVSGDSAGGGLSIALILYLRDHADRFEQVGGGILFSPWTDLTSSCGSWDSNRDFDYLTVADTGDISLNLAHLYLTHAAYDNLITNPYVSSILADLTALPPLMVHSGGAEVLRDEVTLFVERAVEKGVQVEYYVLDGAIHVIQGFVHTEASRVSIALITGWIAQRDSPTPWDMKSIEGLMQREWETRGSIISKQQGGGGGGGGKIRSTAPFEYVAVREGAPRVTVTDRAHPEVKRIVEEQAAKVGVKASEEYTVFLKAQRREVEDGAEGGGGWVQRARRVLHL